MDRERALFITDPRYDERAFEEVKGFEVIIVKEPLREAVTRCQNKGKVFVEFSDFSFSDHRLMKELIGEVEVRDISPEIAAMRMKKEDEEVALIRTASEINRRVFDRFLSFLESGIERISEVDAAVELEYMMKKEGSEAPYFSPIVVSGDNSAVPHAKPSDKRIRKGCGIIIDFGSVYQGYSTDETLSFFAGKPDDDYRRIWMLVRDAKEYALSSIKKGERISVPERKAREFLSKYGMERFFTHSIGHGVGLDVHEPPRLSVNSDGVFEEGMVFTLEPGIYIKGKMGVRLEDVIFLSPEGPEILTIIKKEECINV